MQKESDNKKVKNARIHIYDDKKFRSTLELNCYKLLQESGLTFEHEEHKYILMQGFKFTDNVLLYHTFKPRGKDNKKTYGLDCTKIQDMTYRPDFLVYHKDYIIFIESKGNPNDTYPLKKKLFLNYLLQESNSSGKKYIFFEPRSLRQMKDTIAKIKSL